MNQKARILYYTNSTKITQNDIKNVLVNVGVRKGDVIMVHSDIGTFGKLRTFDRSFLLQSLIDSIKEAVGPKGTIIMPTFTYSFYKNEPYDIKNSKSTVGTLTEYFRKQPRVSRTMHPTHSVAIWGKHKNELLKIGNDTFDKSSIFGKLHQVNAKFVFFGVPFYKSCTFIHYIEQIHGVPYRYMKKFKGKIIKNNKEYEDEIFLYYRYACFFNSFLNLEKHLAKKGLLREAKVGNSSISMIEADVLFSECYKRLDQDSYFLLKNDTTILKLFNNSIYFFLKYFPWPIRIFNDIASSIFRWIKMQD